MIFSASAGRSIAGLVLSQGRHLRKGSLTIRLPSGEVRRFEGSEDGPDADLVVLNWRFFTRFSTGGALGFAESYIDGDCETSDLTALLSFAGINHEAIASTLSGTALYRRLQRLVHRMRPNTVSGARRNIAAHYDLGNAFYEAWLDPTMTYSSAVFEKDAATLSDAQAAKYRLIAERAGLQPGQDVLEIGCGWGGFSEWAAREIGCRVTGLTISNEQWNYARERIHNAGLAEQVAIRLEDYRQAAGHFDRIVSIEMFEAVGEKNWPVYFNRINELLGEGGRAALQVITIADGLFDRYRQSVDFIQRYIFPGGMLPSPPVLQREITAAGLAQTESVGFARHYARTLACWRDRFEAAWPEIRGLGFDERFRRMWRYYLCYCEAGFATDRIDVLQVGVVKR